MKSRGLPCSSASIIRHEQCKVVLYITDPQSQKDSIENVLTFHVHSFHIVHLSVPCASTYSGSGKAFLTHTHTTHCRDCYIYLSSIYVANLWWGAEISTIRFSNSKMLPQENWQAGCKWDDTRPLLCMTNTWLLKTVSARCFIKNTKRKHRTAKTLQGF